MGNGQDSLSLFSQQGLKCLCLAPAWPQLGTPGSISTEGAVDVMQDPAELKTLGPSSGPGEHPRAQLCPPVSLHGPPILNRQNNLPSQE